MAFSYAAGSLDLVCITPISPFSRIWQEASGESKQHKACEAINSRQSSGNVERQAIPPNPQEGRDEM